MNKKLLISIGGLALVALLLVGQNGSVTAQDPAPTSPPAPPVPQGISDAPGAPIMQVEQQPAAVQRMDAIVSTAMSYQGQLQKSGGAYNGNCNFQFSLWDAAAGGAQKGNTIAKTATTVTNGLFSVELDFGDQFTGDARWLQTAVQCTGDAAFITLTPRHTLNAVPYALGLWPGISVRSSHSSAVFTSDNKIGAGLAGYSSGTATNSWGVFGQSESSYGVHGYSANGGAGVIGTSAKGHGVHGVSHSADRSGVYGENDNPNGFAGFFLGRTWTRVVEIAGGSDLAERFSQADGSVAEPGTVMVIDPDHPGHIKPSAGAYDHKVAGIVSGAGDIRPGLTLHQEGVVDGDTVMAIAGRVYVKAEALSGPIQPGDLLTTSDMPGYAMKASDDSRSHGAVIGKAMTGLESGTGLVLVIVNLQ
jgi:hypothetical protein